MSNVLNYLKSYISGLIYKTRYVSSYFSRQRFPLLNAEDTINYIIEKRCSLSRFGDGEFKQVYAYLTNGVGDSDIGFQKYNYCLAERLLEVLKSNLKGHEIGLPSPMFGKDVSKMKSFPRQYWRNQSIKYFQMVKTLSCPGKIYLDSFFTRFYIDYKTNIDKRKYLISLKKIWENRNVLIVEGLRTKLGVGNDLFSEACTIRRILCPPKDAFNSIDRIEDAIRSHVKQDDLVLVALGPTATVISYDMAHYGIQTIDVGHIDIEYEWMLRGAKHKIPIPGKYVNEARCDNDNDEVIDDVYLAQIIHNVN